MLTPAGSVGDRRDRPDRAGAADRRLPPGIAEAPSDRLELQASRHLGAAHARAVDGAVAEVGEAHAHAAHVEALAVHRLEGLADDELGAASADVDDEPAAAVTGEGVGDAEVDQARLLASGDHLDRVAERLLRVAPEALRVVGAAQRVGADRAHGPGRHLAQPLPEALEAGERPRPRLRRQAAVGVEPCREAYRLAQLVDDLDVSVDDARDDQVEAVRAEVHRRQGARSRGGG